MPILVAFAGLPGTGKSTVAKALALASGAVLLRADTVEQAIRAALGHDPGTAGYAAMLALAAENLTLGRDVIADSVNPLAETRDAFADCARRGGARLLDVEIVCSDRAEHRRRVERRVSDVPGLVAPDWAAVETRRLDPWTTSRVVLDTATRSPAQAVALLLAQMEG